MPKGTLVERMYTGLKKHGFSEGSAARIAQARTGKSLATGKAPKSRGTADRDIIRPRRADKPHRGLLGR